MAASQSHTKPGRVVFITGASAGIGRAAALEFAQQGASVAAAARSCDRLAELKQEAAPYPGEILPITADVTQASELEQGVQQIVRTWGQIDVVIANAGIGHRGAIVDADWADLETLLRTNIDGVLHTVRAAAPVMRPGGQVILISSISGVAPAPFAAAYGASKSFLNGLARALRRELQDQGIWVTNILVGQTHTEFAQRRLGQPGRVAGKLPTMTAERVARKIAWAADKRRRSVVLRPIDYGFILAGTLLPGLLDQLQRRVYK